MDVRSCQGVQDLVPQASPAFSALKQHSHTCSEALCTLIYLLLARPERADGKRCAKSDDSARSGALTACVHSLEVSVRGLDAMIADLICRVDIVEPIRDYIA